MTELELAPKVLIVFIKKKQKNSNSIKLCKNIASRVQLKAEELSDVHATALQELRAAGDDEFASAEPN